MSQAEKLVTTRADFSRIIDLDNCLMVMTLHRSDIGIQVYANFNFHPRKIS